MQILMIGGNMTAMRHSVELLSGPGTIVGVMHHRNLFKMRDGSEIHLCVIKKERDVECLRGMRFDMIIEHDTFPRSLHLLELTRAMVLR